MDPALVEDLERQARRLATDVDSVVENLACILQSISALTVDTVETYRWHSILLSYQSPSNLTD